MDLTVKVRRYVLIVRDLHEKTGINLVSGVGIPELASFQEHFRDYKIVVYQGLSCDNIMYECRIESAKRLNVVYDDVERHYHVIRNLRVLWQDVTSVKRVSKVVGETDVRMRPDVY